MSPSHRPMALTMHARRRHRRGPTLPLGEALGLRAYQRNGSEVQRELVPPPRPNPDLTWREVLGMVTLGLLALGMLNLSVHVLVWLVDAMQSIGGN